MIFTSEDSFRSLTLYFLSIFKENLFLEFKSKLIKSNFGKIIFKYVTKSSSLRLKFSAFN